jgi:hypothetical protein
VINILPLLLTAGFSSNICSGSQVSPLGVF